MTLADELALLAYDEAGTNRVGQPVLGYGLAGALLLELALAERLGVADKVVVVLSPAPTGHPLLDEVLARIAADKPRKPSRWVDLVSRDLTHRVLGDLVERGVLNREKDKVLLVFPRTRYPSPGGVRPEPEVETRARLAEAIMADGPADPRTAALGVLVKAVNHDRRVFADLPRARVKARLKEFSQGSWANEAVRRGIEEMQAAIAAAVAGAAAAAAAGS